MNKQKQTYLSPETETLVVRFEDSILQASPLLIYGLAGQNNDFSSGNIDDYGDF